MCTYYYKKYKYYDKGASVSPSIIFNSPTKVIMRIEINNQQQRYAHKITVLQRSKNGRDKRIAEMMKVIYSLRKKKFLDEQQLEVTIACC